MTDRRTHRVVTSRPVDATAARVTGPGPKGDEPGNLIAEVCSPTPLPLRPVPVNPQLPDLTGTVVSRLTVVGFYADGPRWVCRCVCGYYVTRRTHSLQRTKQGPDECARCKHASYLRRNSTYQQLGYNPDLTEQK